MSAEISLPARPAPTNEDAKLADFDSTPLFMKSLPAASEDEENTALAALQNLAYEGTPDGAPTSSPQNTTLGTHSTSRHTSIFHSTLAYDDRAPLGPG